MPRTKTTQKRVKKSTEKSAEQTTASSRFSNIQLNRSYTSLIYGIITVFVIFALIFAGVRNFTDRALTPDIAEEGLQTTIQDENDKNLYTVKEGDSLWNIAVERYQDGFKWNLIAQENNLTEPYELSAGTQLKIPDAPREIAQAEVTPTVTPTEEATTSANPTVVEAQPTAVPTQTVVDTTKGGSHIGGVSSVDQDMSSISGSSYTVHTGDNLWNIAERAYGDGFKWTEIATANNLSNPNIIHSGNVITLPR